MKLMTEEKNNLKIKKLGDLKIAFVHDFLVQNGGAERVLKVLSDMFPDAPIYTMLYDKEKMHGLFDNREVRTSYLQKFPKFLRRRYRWLAPFCMVVPETFDLRDFDLVISSTGAWSKGIVTKLNTVHVAYLHSPMRFVWDYNDKYLKEIKQRRMSFFARFFLNYVRVWDRLAAERPDYLIANSKYTKQRIEKYYRRDSIVIYPPVINEQQIMSNAQQEFRGGKQGVANDYFLVVSRLSPYKKVDMVVEVFNKLELPLVVIGEGEQEKYLRKIAKSNVKIMGWQSDEIVERYYANAVGFVFPAEDDFGMTAIEAMNHGVPVIAYRKGGALETVKEGVTGEFFDSQTPEVLADGVRRFMQKKDSYDRGVIMAHAAEFSEERFKKEIGEFINHVTYNM